MLYNIKINGNKAGIKSSTSLKNYFNKNPNQNRKSIYRLMLQKNLGDFSCIMYAILHNNPGRRTLYYTTGDSMAASTYVTMQKILKNSELHSRKLISNRVIKFEKNGRKLNANLFAENSRSGKQGVNYYNMRKQKLRNFIANKPNLMIS